MAGIRHRNSGMTNGDSIGFADQEETSCLGSIVWTNEKHSMYLKSMEASFIDQLYNSKDLFSWCTPEEHVFHVKLRSRGSPHGFGQKEVHFRATDNNAIEQQPSGSSCRPGNISRMMVDGEHHQVILSYKEEASDQNFVNEPCENRAARKQRVKRSRIQDDSATSHNDQVVPLGIAHSSVQDHYKGCSNSRDRMIGRSGRASNRS